MMLAFDKKYLNKYQIDANKIAGLIPFSGQAITHFTVRNERGIKDTQPVIDDYAPLYFVRADAPRIPAGPRNIGSLSVESYPRGAQVFLNQVPVGVTPLTLSDVQARAYAIQIQADGYSRWSRGIYVTVNQQTRIVAILETAR